MSVIIRLQNLPWSANALDIRQFFQGLSIPDGGVHIVGGEMGDAFIAFSTDEDARQAMAKDRGKLKEIQIRLLLSSRAEMQKVIENARQQSLVMMQAALKQQQQQQQMQQQLQQQQSITMPNKLPLPPVITSTSLNKILHQQPQPINDNSMQSYQSFSMNDNSVDSRDSKDRTSDYRNPSRPSRDRYGRSRSRSISRDRDSRRRSRSRDHSTYRRRDSRSRSRDRRDRRRDRRSGSDDRDYDRRSRSTERKNQRDRDRIGSSFGNLIGMDSNMVAKKEMAEMPVVGTIGALGNLGMWGTSPSQPVATIPQPTLTKGYSTINTNNSLANAPTFSTSTGAFTALQIAQQKLQQQEIQAQQQQPIFSSNMQMAASKTIDSTNQDKPIYSLQGFFKNNQNQMNDGVLRTGDNISGSKPIAFQNPYTLASKGDSGSNSFTGMFGRSNNGKKDDAKDASSDSGQNKQSEINYDELEGHCIKVINMCPSTTYSELRRFFSGLYIANNGIKIINDKHGLRIGAAYIRFLKPESKPKAFARNGAALKSKKITIESVTEDEFDQAIDSFRPTRRFGGRSDDDRKESSSSGKARDEDHRRNDNTKSEDKASFNNLVLEDVPSFATEQDVMRMFSSYTLTDIVLTTDGDSKKHMLCYVKFHRAEDAKKALEESGTHVILHKKIFVSPCSDERFEKAKEKYTMQQVVIEDDDKRDDADSDINELVMDHTDDANDKEDNDNEDASNDCQMLDNKHSNDEENSGSGENSRNADPRLDKTKIPSLMEDNVDISRDGPSDPRKRSSRQGTRFSRPDDNQNKTTYALVKNCEYKSSIRDFMQFFSSAGIPPVRVEILMNSRNQPSGECICEFQNSNNAEQALFQSDTYLGNRRIRIELITVQEVTKRLGEKFIRDSPANTSATNMAESGNMNTMANNMNTMGNMFRMNQNNMMMGMNNFSNPGMNNNFNPSSFNGRNFDSFGGNNGDNNSSNGGSNNPFRGGNNNNNMGSGTNNDQFSGNRNGRGGGRGPRSSRFSDRDDSMSNSNGMNNMNMSGNMMNNNMGGGRNMNTNCPQVLGDNSVDQFGKPGCVIGMENVPYKATIDDILFFFKSFNVKPDSVIRRYNDDGSPTGDARVAFGSPGEAYAALEAKRQKKMLNRTIYLTIV